MVKELYNDGTIYIKFDDTDNVYYIDDYYNSYRARIYNLEEYLKALNNVVCTGHLDIDNVCMGNNIEVRRVPKIKEAVQRVIIEVLNKQYIYDMLKDMTINSLIAIRKRLESRRKGNEHEESSSTYASVS